MQLTLYAPDITCEHCVATIEQTVGNVAGASFLRGDPNARQFDVAVESGAALDELGVALAAEGYPLGEAPPTPGEGKERLGMVDLSSMQEAGATAAGGPAAATEYVVTRTDAGADVNYSCPCGCTAGFAFDRSQTAQAAEGCCCGRQIVVGSDAEARVRAALDNADGYALDVQQVAMPWGQPLDVALAIPVQSGE